MGVIRGAYGVLSRAPLVYTLFMLRFPQEAQLSQSGGIPSAVLAIQAKLKADYPILEKKEEQGIEFAQQQGGQSFSTFNIPEYHFLSSDRTRAVVVKADRLIVHTTDYPDFPTFASWLKTIIGHVMESLDITVFSAVGLRSVDAIVGDKDNHPADALNSQLKPLVLDIDEAAHSMSQYVNVYKTPQGQLILKSYFSELVASGAVIPPDLGSLASKLAFKEPKPDGPGVLLDFDHNFTVADNAVESLDTDKLLTKLKAMHDISSAAFLNAINPDYMENFL